VPVLSSQYCSWYLIKKFFIFYGIRSVNIMLITASNISLCRTRWIHLRTLRYYFFKVHLLIFSHVYLYVANCLLFRFVHQCHIYIPVCCVCVCVCVTCLCYPPCFHCPYNILWGEQSMKLLIQFSVASFIGPNVFLSTPFSNTLIPCFTLIWETKIQTLIKLDAKYGNISYRQVKSVTVTTQHLHRHKLCLFSL
jgi:hypothetical protein